MTRFVALFYPGKFETSLSLSLSVLLKFIVSIATRMICEDDRFRESARADEISLCKVEGEL